MATLLESVIACSFVACHQMFGHCWPRLCRWPTQTLTYWERLWQRCSLHMPAYTQPSSMSYCKYTKIHDEWLSEWFATLFENISREFILIKIKYVSRIHMEKRAKSGNNPGVQQVVKVSYCSLFMFNIGSFV